MMRITMSRLAPVLALGWAIACAGCLEQTDTTSTDESDVAAQPSTTHVGGDTESKGRDGMPSQQLQLKLDIQANGEGNSPSPQPWIKAGPSPQPWNGEQAFAQPNQGSGVAATGTGTHKPDSERVATLAR